jgi:hypothetical protein
VLLSLKADKQVLLKKEKKDGEKKTHTKSFPVENAVE